MKNAKVYYNGTVVEYTDNNGAGGGNIIKSNNEKASSLKKRPSTLIDGFFYDNETGEQLRKKPVFKLNFKTKMRIADAVCLQQQWVEEYNKGKSFKEKVFHCFLIATFPHGVFTAKECSTLFSLFLNRITRKKDGVKSYIWIRELTKKGTPHYHFITIQRYIDIQSMNALWANILKIKSDCCIRSSSDENGKNRMVIKGKGNAIGYVLKYLSKTDSKDVEGRHKITDCSQSLRIDPIILKQDNGYAIKEALRQDGNQGKPLFKKEHVAITSVNPNISHTFYHQIREKQEQRASHLANCSLINEKTEYSFAFKQKRNIFTPEIEENPNKIL